MYTTPILAGQRQNASQQELLDKCITNKDFREKTKVWILRRLKTIIANKMTRKFDQLVYCKLTKFQLECFRRFLDYDEFKASVRGEKKALFAFINLFLKAANHPALFVEGFTEETVSPHVLALYPKIFRMREEFYRVENSGKMLVYLNKYTYILYIAQITILMYRLLG